jgi:hypothetical protein
LEGSVLAWGRLAVAKRAVRGTVSCILPLLEFNMLMPSELTFGEGTGAVCRGKVVRTEAGTNGRRGIAARIESYELT